VGLNRAHARGREAQPHLARERQLHLIQDLGFRVQGSGFRVQGSGFRVQGAGYRVQG